MGYAHINLLWTFWMSKHVKYCNCSKYSLQACRCKKILPLTGLKEINKCRETSHMHRHLCLYYMLCIAAVCLFISSTILHHLSKLRSLCYSVRYDKICIYFWAKRSEVRLCCQHCKCLYVPYGATLGLEYTGEKLCVYKTCGFNGEGCLNICIRIYLWRL